MVVTAEQDAPLALPDPPPRWWLRIGIAVVVVCALVGGGLWAHEHFLVRCADGVSRTGPYDECIGVTDGAHHFDDHLADVIGRIHTENERIEGLDAPRVSVVYFEPMTLGEGDKGWTSIEQELQGAYVAQRVLNTSGQLPKVKLLLANPGRGSEQWRTVVRQIVAMTDDPNPVVAVAGFGQSRRTTLRAVRELRRQRVPMVGSTVTADQLSEQEEPFFYRAVSPNSVQAEAAARYLRKLQDSKQGLTVRVIKDLNGKDIYSRSLLEGFLDATADPGIGLDVDPMELRFFSKEQGIHNALDAVARRVCAEAEDDPAPDAVYFAGRGRDLKRFIEAAGRLGGPCPITVHTGDDAVGMFFDAHPQENREAYESFLQTWKDTRITVKYTALAHPDAATRMGPTEDAYEKFRKRYTGEAVGEWDHLGDVSDLLNGQAMLGHDAVKLLGTTVQISADAEDAVSTSSVLQAFSTYTDEEPFAGVSGAIGYDADNNHDQSLGDPRKELPLVVLTPFAPDSPQSGTGTPGDGATCDRQETAPARDTHRSVCELVLPAVPGGGAEAS